MSVTSNQPASERSRQKAQTRRALLDAGRACFAEHGFEGSHVAHVAARAGVAHGTFYVHFANKATLLDALLEELNERLREDVGRALASPGALEDRVHEAASAFLGICLDQAPLVRAYAERATGGVALDELVEGINPPALALLRAVLAARVPDAEVELAAHGLLAMWLRVALRVLFAGADRAAAARTLTAMTLGAVRALEGGAP